MLVHTLPSGNYALSYPSAFFKGEPYINIAVIRDMDEFLDMAKRIFESAYLKLGGVKYSGVLESKGIIVYHTTQNKYIINPNYLENIKDLKGFQELVRDINKVYDSENRLGINDVFNFPEATAA